MSKVIVFDNGLGGVAVCNPSGEIPVEDVLKKDCPTGAIIVDRAALPNADEDFFDAWVLNGTNVTVSLQKAKEVTKRRLRLEREPLLAAQDVAFQRALEEGKPTDAIVAEKQRLRDVTTKADTCTTTAELRALNCAK